jgi:hypothetical protein
MNGVIQITIPTATIGDHWELIDPEVVQVAECRSAKTIWGGGNGRL